MNYYMNIEHNPDWWIPECQCLHEKCKSTKLIITWTLNIEYYYLEWWLPECQCLQREMSEHEINYDMNIEHWI